MKERLGTAEAAKRVLDAFPVPRLGAAIPHDEMEAYFHRRHLADTDLESGLRHALQLGWIKTGALNTFVMQDEGMDALVQQSEPESHTEAPSFSVEGG